MELIKIYLSKDVFYLGFCILIKEFIYLFRGDVMCVIGLDYGLLYVLFLLFIGGCIFIFV